MHFTLNILESGLKLATAVSQRYLNFESESKIDFDLKFGSIGFTRIFFRIEIIRKNAKINKLYYSNKKETVLE